MSPGPLRRLIGMAGLVAMAPVLWQLAVGNISAEDAVLRAGAILLVAWALGRIAQLALLRLARRFERRAADRDASAGVSGQTQPAGGAEPRRRKTDGR